MHRETLFNCSVFYFTIPKNAISCVYFQPLSRYPVISSHWLDMATIIIMVTWLNLGKYLIIPFLQYTSLAYQARLISPWVFWCDVLPKYEPDDSTKLEYDNNSFLVSLLLGCWGCIHWSSSILHGKIQRPTTLWGDGEEIWWNCSSDCTDHGNTVKLS